MVKFNQNTSMWESPYYKQFKKTQTGILALINTNTGQIYVINHLKYYA